MSAPLFFTCNKARFSLRGSYDTYNRLHVYDLFHVIEARPLGYETVLCSAQPRPKMCVSVYMEFYNSR